MMGGRRNCRIPPYESFKGEMEREGVLVFDAAPVLMGAKAQGGQVQYLMTDTHWRPEAVELAAERLKEFILGHVSLPPLPPAGYRAKISGITQLGDLAVMLGLPAHQRIFPRGKVSIRKVFGADGEPWQPQRTADVLVLGDSFSNIYSLGAMGWGEGAGFIEQLSYALQRPLDRITRNDNGSHATRGFTPVNWQKEETGGKAAGDLSVRDPGTGRRQLEKDRPETRDDPAGEVSDPSAGE